jgi:hypothetical protein
MKTILTPVIFLILAAVSLFVHLASGITCAVCEWWLAVRNIWKEGMRHG